jgi:hypothetical protein
VARFIEVDWRFGYSEVRPSVKSPAAVAAGVTPSDKTHLQVSNKSSHHSPSDELRFGPHTATEPIVSFQVDPHQADRNALLGE